MKRRGKAGEAANKSRRRKALARLPRTQNAQAQKQRLRRRAAAQLDLRTRELAEAREQQAATAEVLHVISSSQGELEPVFQSMLENATRICDAKFGTLFRFDGQRFHLAAGTALPPAFAEFQRKRGPFLPDAGTQLDIVLRTKQVAHSSDRHVEGVPGPSVKLGGARSQIAVPMLKDNELIGAIVIYRQEVRPFIDKQVELVSHFAAQAVIAIENARLLSELRQRTDDLTRVAGAADRDLGGAAVISSSPGELEPVFNAMLDNATRICGAKFGIMYLYEQGKFRPAALASPTPELEAFLKERGAFAPNPDQPLGRLLMTKEVVHTFEDVSKDHPQAIAACQTSAVREPIWPCRC